MKTDYLKRSRLACGVALICVLFGLETVLAHSRFPNAASPLIWTVLGSVGLGCLVYGWWCARLARAPG